MVDDIGRFISELGFPIFVSLYFMFRLEKRLKENTTILRELHAFIRSIHTGFVIPQIKSKGG